MVVVAFAREGTPASSRRPPYLVPFRGRECCRWFTQITREATPRCYRSVVRNRKRRPVLTHGMLYNKMRPVVQDCIDRYDSAGRD